MLALGLAFEGGLDVERAVGRHTQHQQHGNLYTQRETQQLVTSLPPGKAKLRQKHGMAFFNSPHSMARAQQCTPLLSAHLDNTNQWAKMLTRTHDSSTGTASTSIGYTLAFATVHSLLAGTHALGAMGRLENSIISVRFQE